MNRLRVLILLGYYVPGYKAGGPIRSIANLVAALGDEFDFKIVTMDHDLGNPRPYAGIQPDVWTPVGKAQVMYLSARGRRPWSMLGLLRRTPYDVLYLNSLFSRPFSIFPLWLQRLGLIRRTPVILAARGETAPPALAHHRLRKRLYLAALRWTRVADDVLWQASSDYEQRDLERVLGTAPHISQALPLPAQRVPGRRNAPRTIVAVDAPAVNLPSPKTDACNGKARGRLNLIYLARVHPHKNLHYALSLLSGLRGSVRFRIYGLIENQAYWQRCQAAAAALPANIAVEYGGHVNHTDVQRVLSENDLFLLPTRSENFGHSILEAFCAGCPVLIADTTPWRNLEQKKVGWDIPLAEPERFRAALEQCLDMDAAEFTLFSQRAQQYGIEQSRNPEILDQNRRLFATAVDGRRRAA
jgi:glycosyltransferase involved in cell wall biosynthesis